MRVIILLFIGQAFFIRYQTAMAQDLTSLRWQNRIVVIQADGPENQELQKQIAIFASEEEGLSERKLVVFQNIGDNTTNLYKANEEIALSPYVQKTLQRMDSNFKILLIGLDGSVKLKQASAVTVNQLFDLIDIMPMRRAEKARKKN